MRKRTRFVAQGIKVCGIAQVRQVGNHYIQQPGFCRCPGTSAMPACSPVVSPCLKLTESSSGGAGFRAWVQHPKMAYPCAAATCAKGRIKQAGITAKFVENKSAHPVALGTGQQCHCARKSPLTRAAPVNIGHQSHQSPSMPGHAHV